MIRFLFLFLFSLPCWASPFVIGGVSFQTKSENGTWYDAKDPYTFTQQSFNYGLGYRGEAWSIAYENLGVETSYAATEGYKWYGRQRPRGVWASWEPTIGGAFAQIGAGAFKSDFTMTVPNSTAPYIANHKIHPSYLVGVGYRMESWALVSNVRYVGTSAEKPNDNAVGLGKFAATVSIEYHI
jgi:hypothetical protein